MKRFLVVLITIILMMGISTNVYARAGAHSSSHSTAKSTSSKSTSSTSSKTTITKPKTYTTPKTFKSKYNSDNIKKEVVNSTPVNYQKYSTSNMFTPNFWTAMWVFQCMHDNTEQVTEQDIAKELEERGYSEEEINEILAEGEEAKKAVQKEEDEKHQVFIKILAAIAVAALIIILICIFV